MNNFGPTIRSRQSATLPIGVPIAPLFVPSVPGRSRPSLLPIPLSAMSAMTALSDSRFLKYRFECIRRERLNQMSVVARVTALLLVISRAVTADCDREFWPIWT
jgi:hypothetical protein